jgi:hypothetical protein
MVGPETKPETSAMPTLIIQPLRYRYKPRLLAWIRGPCEHYDPRSAKQSTGSSVIVVEAYQML